jgi:hypothetical protein
MFLLNDGFRKIKASNLAATSMTRDENHFLSLKDVL